MGSGEQQVEAELVAARARYERDELLGISRALSSERDIRKLLDLILLKSRQITGADAGSVYVLETQEDAGQSPASGRSSPGLQDGHSGDDTHK